MTRYYVLKRDLDRDDAFELEKGLELVQVMQVIRDASMPEFDRVILVVREGK